MRDDVKWCVDALREGACCCACNEAYPTIDRPFPCEQRVRTNDNMDKAAVLIESLAAELEQVKRERDALQAELDALNEEYFSDVHTARDPMVDKIRQLELERDAAVKDLHMWACFSCKHAGYADSEICASCVYNRNRIAKGYVSGKNRYEWRGVKEDSK